MDKVKGKVKVQVSPILWTDFDAVFCFVSGQAWSERCIEKSALPMDFVALIKLRWCARTTTYIIKLFQNPYLY